ncbi:uncharacterized protein BYT42DRAFT_582628 [Radiomyces spectabilis]|uniref:uncharacterized protein n=1 Tax=Radiomyces spectabilis TaxID=64574 RepID=UPI00221E528A|nr:uncharacterized protein BYT42DRAFT_582628 [Radiomyces spectabilis]KAI8370500.1 hypothetical protein BYT42DRAFT_582628 [Radiomyces spectabilis]
MKSLYFMLLNKKFDDQYTFDLHGILSVQDFCSAMSTINRTMRESPPPGNTGLWLGIVWTVWILLGAAIYMMWNHVQQRPYILVIMPILMLAVSLLVFWKHRRSQIKFEKTVMQVCNQLNAIENVRGINFRFTKNGATVIRPHLFGWRPWHKTVYAILIEFDDRYNALVQEKAVKYAAEGFVTVPLQPASVHYAQGLSEKSTHAYYYPNLWTDIPTYVEKTNYKTTPQ